MTNQLHTLYVFLPCYNEAGNIDVLMDKWLHEREFVRGEGFSLTIKPIDDKSTDTTKDILLEYSARHDCIEPLYHEVNQNLGGVLNTAIVYFMEHSVEGDYMLLMDGDNTHEPKYIHPLLKNRNQGDVIICSRYREGSKVVGLSKFREMMSVNARLVYSAFLQVPGVRDYTCGYRLYNREAILRGRERFGEKLVEEKNFSCMMELLYKLYLTGSTFYEVPFILRYDFKEGESKMDVTATSKRSLELVMKLRRFEKSKR